MKSLIRFIETEIAARAYHGLHTESVGEAVKALEKVLAEARACATRDEEYAERIREADANWDKETGHRDADALLCDLLKSLGFTKTVEAFGSITKWYS